MKVLKFGAVWCPGCLVMKPRWKEIESENDWLKTEYYDADESEDVLKQYQVGDLPTFIFLDKDGKELERIVGQRSKEILVEKINQYKDK